jgi:DNA polymerase I-like protein with 3'-5' exonuclease and polymerase domains
VSITSDFQQLGDVICLDLETAMAPACFEGRSKVRLLQLLCDEGECWYDLATFTDADWAELKVCLENPALTVIGQNLFFDYRCLLGCGITLRGRLEDTMIQSALLTNGLPGVSNSLEAIAKRVCGLTVDKTLQKQDWMNAELNDADLAYAMGDVRVTYQAWREMRAQIKQAGLQQVYDLECALIPAVVQVEHSGLRIDTEQAAAAIEQLEAEITESRGLFIETLDGLLIETTGTGLPRDEDGSYNLRAKDEGAIRLGTKRYAGFNVNSAQQVLVYLKLLGIEPIHPKTGKPSTDKKALSPMADLPVVSWLREYKRAEKRRSMIQAWLDKHIAADGRIHARFAPLSTGTGRFTCSAPNLQQVPRESYIRDCFVAAGGCELVVMDVKNMEMGVACAKPIADEFLMQQALRDGVDLHSLTAHLIFGVPIEEVTKDQRQRAKCTNFGLLFGSGAGGLKDYFASFGHSITIEEALQFRQAWLDAYPAMAAWHRWAKREVDKGEVRMVDGRRRWLVGDLAKPTVLLNNTVQGTAASIVKLTMVKALPQLPTGGRLVAQIHDEIIAEVPTGAGQETLAMLQRCLLAAGREVIGDSVDMLGEGDVALSWGKAK